MRPQVIRPLPEDTELDLEPAKLAAGMLDILKFSLYPQSFADPLCGIALL
jgi:hypothetical protein